MKRPGMPKRKTWIPRGKRINRVNRARRAKEFERAYGGESRHAWVLSQPCCVSGQMGGVVNAHVKTFGMGMKADARFVIPLADHLHRELHALGIATFAARYGVDLFELAAQTEASWQAHIAQRTPQ